MRAIGSAEKALDLMVTRGMPTSLSNHRTSASIAIKAGPSTLMTMDIGFATMKMTRLPPPA